MCQAYRKSRTLFVTLGLVGVHRSTPTQYTSRSFDGPDRKPSERYGLSNDTDAIIRRAAALQRNGI